MKAGAAALVAVVIGVIPAHGELRRSSIGAVDVASQRNAARAGALGAVTGRAVATAPTPNPTVQPLVGMSVVLLPRSDDVVQRLAEIKAQTRQSVAAYRAAIADVRQLRDSYEAAVRAAGSPELIRHARLGPDGSFALDDVPAGRWLLIAEQAGPAKTRPTVPPKKGSDHFTPRPQLASYRGVTVWLVDVEVEAGVAEHVELTDRNGWLNGVEEQFVTPGAGR